MITAQEALYLSTKNAQKIDIPKEIEDGILNGCNIGTWKYEHPGTIETKIQWLLESLGYKVNRFTILGKPYTQISWNND